MPAAMASGSSSNAPADVNADLRAARRQLASLPKFDDEGKPMSESEWRYEFLIATRDLSDKQRAAVWIDHLQYEGEAYYWFQAQKASKSGTDDWSKLKDLIEARWPTPVRDPDAFEERNRIRWNSSVLDIDGIADALSERSNPTRPHHIWATQHLAKGRACDSTDKDRVYHTLHYALPPFVVALLPKKYRYGADFSELCKDIGEIPAWELYEAWQRETTLSRLETLSLTPPPPQPPTPYTPKIRRNLSTSLTPSLPPSAMRGTPSAPPPSLPSSLQVPSRGHQVSFADPPQAPSTPISTAPIPRPVFGTATRQAPPHLSAIPQQVTQAAVSGPVQVYPPAPTAHTATATVTRRVPNTDADIARYNAATLAWMQQYEGQSPSLAKPYPLSPGTLEQTRLHKAIDCKAEPAHLLPEHERSMRGAILRDMNRSARNSRAGTVPGTPSPPTRVRDVQQLELSEPEDETYYTDFYDSENK
ncbi:hypothetical protein FRC10_004078 [Ceratobasidium sp. 414]|nr:hypothetical protein FRC10_004078 [Ceratobasidium sp. 414]